MYANQPIYIFKAMKQRKNLEIEPETDIHVTITSIDDIDDYGNAVYQGLKEVQKIAMRWLMMCVNIIVDIVSRTTHPGPYTL